MKFRFFVFIIALLSRNRFAFVMFLNHFFFRFRIEYQNFVRRDREFLFRHV